MWFSNNIRNLEYSTHYNTSTSQIMLMTLSLRYRPIVSLCVLLCLVLYGSYKFFGLLEKGKSVLPYKITARKDFPAWATTRTIPGASPGGEFVGHPIVYDGYTRDCLTGEVLYKWSHTDQSNWQKFRKDPQDDIMSSESFEERKDSFDKIFRIFRKLQKREGSQAEDNLNTSGEGAIISRTLEVMGCLHVLINTLKVLTGKTTIRILDVPCGDLQWMHLFLQTRTDVVYTGMDIVADVIKYHQTKYRDLPNVHFINADVLSPEISVAGYDIIMCRDMLQNLETGDIVQLLHKYSNSGSSFLLTTTFQSENKTTHLPQVDWGRYRPINVEIPPFSLSPPVCLHHDGWLNKSDQIHPPHHQIALWKLPLYSIKNCNISNISRRVLFQNIPVTKFSCL